MLHNRTLTIIYLAGEKSCTIGEEVGHLGSEALLATMMIFTEGIEVVHHYYETLPIG